MPLDSPQEVLSDLLLPTRVADARVVLDRLADVAGGPERRQILPPSLAADLDLSKVGMFGHSLGGPTTAQAIHDDPRIRAGVNLDGPNLGSVAADGLDRPLLMLASGKFPCTDAVRARLPILSGAGRRRRRLSPQPSREQGPQTPRAVDAHRMRPARDVPTGHGTSNPSSLTAQPTSLFSARLITGTHAQARSLG